MIYLQKTTTQQTVFVPTASPLVGAFALKLYSTVDRREIYQVAGFASGDTRLSVSVAVRLPRAISAGEYEYRIEAGGVTVDSGLAVVGEWGGAKQYTEQIEYKQVNNGR